MKKKKGGNNILAVTVLFLFVAAMVYMAVSRGSSTAQANKNKLYDEVMALDFTTDYPSSPDEVLSKYNTIDMFLSGNTSEDFSNSDLETVVEKQRMLLHPELLALNPFDEHIKGYVDKIDYAKENELRIMQIVNETPRFSEDAKSCSINAKQYWSQHIQVNLVYELSKDFEGNWKIIGWYVNEQLDDEDETEGENP